MSADSLSGEGGGRKKTVGSVAASEVLDFAGCMTTRRRMIILKLALEMCIEDIFIE